MNIVGLEKYTQCRSNSFALPSIIDCNDFFPLKMSGEMHNATSELLGNQKSLRELVANLSAILEIVQRGRSGLALKLAVQLGDLTPYHETFGCAHK